MPPFHTGDASSSFGCGTAAAAAETAAPTGRGTTALGESRDNPASKVVNWIARSFGGKMGINHANQSGSRISHTKTMARIATSPVAYASSSSVPLKRQGAIILAPESSPLQERIRDEGRDEKGKENGSSLTMNATTIYVPNSDCDSPHSSRHSVRIASTPVSISPIPISVFEKRDHPQFSVNKFKYGHGVNGATNDSNKDGNHHRPIAKRVLPEGGISINIPFAPIPSVDELNFFLVDGDHQEPQVKKKRRGLVKKKDIPVVIQLADDDEEEDQIHVNQASSQQNSEAAASEALLQAARKKALAYAHVLEFFNTAQAEALVEASGCTAETANTVVSKRPFSDIDDLKSCLCKIKKSFGNFIDKVKDVLHGYKQVDDLIRDCERVGERLANVLEGVKAGTPIIQPSYVNPNLQLKSYQLYGVRWLGTLQEHGMGGILADEMGLGKTAQVITFLAGLPAGPHLVIVPSSTLDNWRREFDKWVPSLNILPYVGSQSERFGIQLEAMASHDIDIVLTTYNTATSTKEDRSFIRKMKFQTMILDEGHMVKSLNSARTKHLSSFKTPFRLLLTGTPLQNNLMELLSLLMFVMPDLFGSESASSIITRIFTMQKSAANSDEESFLAAARIHRARQLMTPFILRRKKADVLSDLPPKVREVIMCSQTPTQTNVYQSIIKDSKAFYLSNTKDAAAQKRLSNILMQLRKASNHPMLFRTKYTDDIIQEIAPFLRRELEFCDYKVPDIVKYLRDMSDFEIHKLCLHYKYIGKFALSNQEWMDSGKVQKLKEILPGMIAKGDRILIFSQFVVMLDILEAVLGTLGIPFCRLDGSTPITDRQIIIDEFNNTPSIPIFLLSTKAGGLGINLTSANCVLLYDMDFNPHNDAQAEDRAHRVGQTRQVRIIKLILERSVEQHMLRCANAKLKLDRRLQESDEQADIVAESALARRKSVDGANPAPNSDIIDLSNEDNGTIDESKVLDLLRTEWRTS